MTGRANPIHHDDATDEQRQLWDTLLESRGGAQTLVAPDGTLRGPFNHMVTNPTLGRRMGDLGHAVRFEASIERRLQELAISTVGAHWRSNFEFWAHGRMAIDQGIDPGVIEALADGREPEFERDDEAEVHAFAAQLVATGRVDQDRYDAVRDRVGATALADLITTIGYYSLVSLTLNAHEVPLPEGNDPIWPE